MGARSNGRPHLDSSLPLLLRLASVKYMPCLTKAVQTVTQSGCDWLQHHDSAAAVVAPRSCTMLLVQNNGLISSCYQQQSLGMTAKPWCMSMVNTHMNVMQM